MNGQVDTAISAMNSQVVARVVKLINGVAKWVRTISARGSQASYWDGQASYWDGQGG
jgi:hypothetical protein